MDEAKRASLHKEYKCVIRVVFTMPTAIKTRLCRSTAFAALVFSSCCNTMKYVALQALCSLHASLCLTEMRDAMQHLRKTFDVDCDASCCKTFAHRHQMLCLANNNHNNNHYMFQHTLLGMCGTSPISPGRLVLSVAIWTPDVQLLKVRQNNVTADVSC